MTITVAVSNGVGAVTGQLVAFDRAAAFSITGLESGFYSAAVTGLLTTPDGKTALAALATGTASGAGAVTLTFDTDTANMLEYMGPGKTLRYHALLTVYATGTTAYACMALVPLVMGARSGTTAAATTDTTATLAEAQALVDAHGALTTTAHGGEKLLLDQTTPQTVTGGAPIFGGGAKITGSWAFAAGVHPLEIANPTDTDMWVKLRSGLTSDYRAYLAWYAYTDAYDYRWLLGRNRLNAFICYDASGSNHVLYAESGSTTHLAAGGTGAIKLQYDGAAGTAAGTGGVECYSGGAAPALLWYSRPTGHWFGAPTASAVSLLTLKQTAYHQDPVYGDELLSADNWTSADWTGSWAAGWTHTTGNTTALSNTLAAVASTKYQIAYTVTGRTAGSFTIAFGGATTAALTTTGAYGPTASSTANLVVTPTTDFNGTVVLSIKAITGPSTALYTHKSTYDTVQSETRFGSYGARGVFVGTDAGSYVTTGSYNVGLLDSACQYLTTGASNIGIGYKALQALTVGSYNTAIQREALAANTTGSYNLAIGYQCLAGNVAGTYNWAAGYQSLYTHTGGTYNLANGYQALYALSSGSYNWAVGYRAGRYIADGATALSTANSCLYLGRNTRAGANSVTNEIVIGDSAIGLGSNTAVLGDTNIATTQLRGNVRIGSADSNKALFGAGQDASIYYDGADLQIKANEVAASDIHLVTGATKAVKIDGAATLGAAATDVITCTGRMVLRTLASDPQDGTPGNRPAGSVAEIAYYNAKLYLCVNAATPAWELVTSAA